VGMVMRIIQRLSRRGAAVACFGNTAKVYPEACLDLTSVRLTTVDAERMSDNEMMVDDIYPKSLQERTPTPNPLTSRLAG
jgi:hypothetical protein